MANNNSYFYISGFISLSLFLFFFSLIIFMMFSSSKIETYALKKDNYISISISLPKIETTISEKSIDMPTAVESVIESKDVNIDDLFSDVWTKSINKQKKKPSTDNKRLQEIAKKSKKIDNKNIKKVLKKTNDNNRNKSDELQKTSAGSVVNEYMAKITGLVYEAFHPRPDMQGNVVEAVLEISAMGKVVDFRILTPSASQSLNEECQKMKDRLIGKLFPMHPDKKSSTIRVNIIPENKGKI